LVTLQALKRHLSVRSTDKQKDADYERAIGAASSSLERAVGRRLIFRHDPVVGTQFAWAPTAFDVTAFLPPMPSGGRMAVGMRWDYIPAATAPSGNLVATGTLDGEVVVTRVAIDGGFAEFYGRELFDTVTSVVIEPDAAGTDVKGTAYLVPAYEEFHDTQRASLVYAVNRPLAVLDEVAEGGLGSQYLVLLADTQYVSDPVRARIQKVGFSGAGTSGITIGPDYPEDEYFRFPRGRGNAGPSFVSGQRSVRLRYTGGYQGDADRTAVPSDVAQLVMEDAAKIFRGEAFKETELTSQSDSAGTRTKQNAKEWAERYEAFARPHRCYSVTASVQIA
jgi:hypothetical protein